MKFGEMMTGRVRFSHCALLIYAIVLAAPKELYAECELKLDGFKGLSFDNYNRVDGLPVTYGFSGKGESFEFRFRAIYRIASERFGWRSRVTFDLIRNDLRLSVGTYSFSDTRDRWRVGDFENSLSSILFKEDFRNYFQRQGLSLSIDADFFAVLNGQIGYRYDRYTSLGQTSDFGILGWNKEFRPNPEVREGWMGSLEFEVELDTRNDPDNPTIGWYHSFLYEVSDPALGGVFDFRYAELTVHRYNKLGRGKNLNMRFFGVTASNSAPPQRGVHIHGVGGLRGFPDDFTPHNKAFLTTLEARFALGREYRRTSLFRDQIEFLLFADIGGVQEYGTAKGFDVDGDIGLGLGGAGLFSYSGIFLALRMEDDDTDLRLTFRVRRSF